MARSRAVKLASDSSISVAFLLSQVAGACVGPLRGAAGAAGAQAAALGDSVRHRAGRRAESAGAGRKARRVPEPPGGDPR